MRRRVGLLGHESPLYDELDASENVRFWTRAAGGPRRPTMPWPSWRLDGRLAAVPVPSAGQRRRVALAVLVAPPPSCGCSTNPTPDSTRRDGSCLTGSSAGRRPPGPLCSWRHTRASVWPLSEPGSWRWSAERSVPAPGPSGRWPVLADARVVAAKDLRSALRSRVVADQVLPLALLILVLFAFALDPDRGSSAEQPPASTGWPCCWPPSSRRRVQRRVAAGCGTPCASRAWSRWACSSARWPRWRPNSWCSSWCWAPASSCCTAPSWRVRPLVASALCDSGSGLRR